MPPSTKQPPAPVVLDTMIGMDELAKTLNISRRLLERLRAAKSIPEPDLVLGRMPRWKPETIKAWIDQPKPKGK
ncbi:helix-turn-helix transcriptional regulator [Singulisphaera sp. PoT]|uniref:helix-turn-helix transcriptional regulator n=1 Tax=Singulisphaera sp. PoT TaxID=3411797 RepID=UPI003BF57C82